MTEDAAQARNALQEPAQLLESVLNLVPNDAQAQDLLAQVHSWLEQLGGASA